MTHEPIPYQLKDERLVSSAVAWWMGAPVKPAQTLVCAHNVPLSDKCGECKELAKAGGNW